MEEEANELLPCLLEVVVVGFGGAYHVHLALLLLHSIMQRAQLAGLHLRGRRVESPRGQWRQ